MIEFRKAPKTICNLSSYYLSKMSVILGLSAFIFATCSANSFAQTEKEMNDEEAQKTWEEYYERIKKRRLAEADILWSTMTSNGVSDETVLAVDFRMFCSDEVNANRAAEQLSENYGVSLKFDALENVWFVDVTTRPTGVTFSKDMHSDWVSFMADLSAQYECVFLNWTFESPKLEMIFESEKIETNLP